MLPDVLDAKDREDESAYDENDLKNQLNYPYDTSILSVNNLRVKAFISAEGDS